MNFKMQIQYDGSRYEGWQRQTSTPNTIQGKIEEVLTRMAGSTTEIHGAGRTDAGVHALGQIANFYLSGEWEAGEEKSRDIQEYLNRYLPDDIAVTGIEVVPERFHSRLNAKKKIYRYRILTGTVPKVFERKYLYPLKEQLDIKRMQRAADILSGTHDFKAFCSNNKMKKSTVRTIYSIDIQGEKDEIILTFTGDGFLYNMVRIMVGTLIEVGLLKREPEELSDILKQRDRQLAGFTAPARGLSLIDVIY